MMPQSQRASNIAVAFALVCLAPLLLRVVGEPVGGAAFAAWPRPRPSDAVAPEPPKDPLGPQSDNRPRPIATTSATAARWDRFLKLAYSTYDTSSALAPAPTTASSLSLEFSMYDTSTASAFTSAPIAAPRPYPRRMLRPSRSRLSYRRRRRLLEDIPEEEEEPP